MDGNSVVAKIAKTVEKTKPMVEKCEMEDWLDREEYPFSEKYFDLPMGRMHYVDEGESEHVIVMVHGNPAWSFTYRRLIKCLSKKYRCIAPDHIGFGLSDKPAQWDYLPESHALNFEKLLGDLDIKSITLVVGDWGGPIGLSYALSHPDKIKSIVITNTWMWPVKGIFHYEMFSKFMGGIIGRTLIRKYNFFVTVLMKRMFRTEIDPSIHQHYIEPLKAPDDRKGCWIFPKQIIDSSNWLSVLWNERAAIADKPAMIVWGNKDIAFRRIELDKWKTLLQNVEVHAYDGVGHFVQEELGDDLCPLVEKHLEKVLA
jgi:haloalkane dehalogenase